MSKRKIFILAGIVILALAAAFVFYWLKPGGNRQANEFNNQRVADLREKNPGLLEKLLSGIQRDEKAVKEKSDNYEAWRDLGAAYEAIGEYDLAEKAYKKSGEINKVNTVVWNNLGELYKSQGRFEQAKDAFLKLLEADPSSIDTYLKLAEMYADGHAGTLDGAKFILGQGILKTNSQTLKDAQERLNKEGKL